MSALWIVTGVVAMLVGLGVFVLVLTRGTDEIHWAGRSHTHDRQWPALFVSREDSTI
jgi:hypothetical protein